MAVALTWWAVYAGNLGRFQAKSYSSFLAVVKIRIEESEIIFLLFGSWWLHAEQNLNEGRYIQGRFSVGLWVVSIVCIESKNGSLLTEGKMIFSS